MVFINEKSVDLVLTARKMSNSSLIVMLIPLILFQL
jgi:hypothetical protein